MPSLHEGLPYTLLEAMALGKPIVATSVGGLKEVLQNEETALLCEPSRLEDIALAVGRIVKDAKLRKRIGSAAEEVQRSKFTLAEMGRNYLNVYKSLVKRSDDTCLKIGNVA